jgi:hypothetical protein
MEEIQKDKDFAKRLSKLQFLTATNFDIDPIHQNENKYQMAMNGNLNAIAGILCYIANNINRIEENECVQSSARQIDLYFELLQSHFLYPYCLYYI